MITLAPLIITSYGLLVVTSGSYHESSVALNYQTDSPYSLNQWFQVPILFFTASSHSPLNNIMHTPYIYTHTHTHTYIHVRTFVKT